MTPETPREREEPQGILGPRAHRALLPLFCALLPGFLAGIQLAGLLFFLNPHWPFQPAPLLRTAALYSTMLAIGSALLVLPFTWGNPERARRVLPWAVFLTFAAAGIAHWVHAARFSFFLPAGINRRLIKAALWLSLAAVVTFYTALLHSMQKRPYGRRSRAGILLLCFLASYVVFERREAFRPEPPPAPRSSAVPASEHPSLLVVGIEGLTMDVVLPLARQGELPFLAQILRQGSAGRVAGVTPSHRLPSWFTLTTGKFPFRHGVVGDRRYSASFVQPGLEFRLIPVGLGFRRWGIPGGELPNSASPAEHALNLWEITAGLGLDTAVLDWPGAALADPRDFLEGAANLFIAERAAVDPAELPPLPPDLAASPPLDQAAFAGDLATVNRALHWLEQQRPAVSLDNLGGPLPAPKGKAIFVGLRGALEVSQETFGAYSSVQFDGVLGDGRKAAADRLVSYYRALDGLLKDLWNQTPEPRWMILVSPYGLRTREGLEHFGSLVRSQREFDGKTGGAPDGAFMAFGGLSVEPGRFLSRLEITDLAPTILYGTSLPAARDLDGRVRTEIFRTDWLSTHTLTYVPSYETLVFPKSGASGGE